MVFVHSMGSRAVEKEAGRLLSRSDMHRSWLCAQREREISRALEELEDLLAETRIPLEIRERLARKVLERYKSQNQRYSAAVTQCLQRVWTREFPERPIPMRS